MLGDLWFYAWQSAPKDTAYLAQQLARRKAGAGGALRKNEVNGCGSRGKYEWFCRVGIPDRLLGTQAELSLGADNCHRVELVALRRVAQRSAAQSRAFGWSGIRRATGFNRA